MTTLTVMAVDGAFIVVVNACRELAPAVLVNASEVAPMLNANSADNAIFFIMSSKDDSLKGII